MLNITGFSIRKNNAFTEVNTKGLYIYNSPSNYIKFGSGESEIRTESLKVTNLSVYGNLYVYGTQVVGATSTALASTSMPNFTIGTTTSEGNTSLILGNYGIENKLTANGSTITSSVPFNAPNFYVNGSPVLNSITREELLLSEDTLAGTTLDIPNSKTYILSSNRLLVFINGDLKISGVSNDYVEETTSSISFNYDLASGAKITFIILG